MLYRPSHFLSHPFFHRPLKIFSWEVFSHGAVPYGVRTTRQQGAFQLVQHGRRPPSASLTHLAFRFRKRPCLLSCENYPLTSALQAQPAVRQTCTGQTLEQEQDRHGVHEVARLSLFFPPAPFSRMMQQCWAWHAAERPSFAQLSQLLNKSHPTACDQPTAHKNSIAQHQAEAPPTPALVLNPLRAWQDTAAVGLGDDEDETRI